MRENCHFGRFGAVILLLVAMASYAQDNPFEAAARVAYSGVYEGKDADGKSYVLVLCERGEHFDGTITRDGNRLLVEGTLEHGAVVGEMKEHNGANPSVIKVTFKGNGAIFIAGIVKVNLTRRDAPPFKGIFGTGEVKLSLESGAGDALTGGLKFNNKMYEVQARANGALCWGSFGGGGKTWPFTLVRESSLEVRFATGSFSQSLTDASALEHLPAEEKRILLEILESMVRIPVGSFKMGTENGGSEEKPVHEVTISRPFYLGKYEVTQAQWEAVMGSNPSYFKGSNLPVEWVSWEDCQEFIKQLNSKGIGIFRLPTEAEWEYACRAGTTGDYAGNLDEMAWYKETSSYSTHPVGTKKPNPWGLYDMHGNICEWCQDWSGDYPTGAVRDPRGAAGGSHRVFRGGCCYSIASHCRSASRNWDSPSFRYYALGFRLVRTVP